MFLLTTDKRRSKFLKEINEELYYSEIIDSNTFINEDNLDYSEFYKNNSSMNPLSLSSSKINTYNQCQLRYKYSSLDLIPGFQYNSVFALGNIVHKVLEEFHKNHFNSFGNILNLLDKYWNHNLYSYVCESEQYYRDAKAMLENYMSYLDENIPSPVLFEHYFKIKMKDYVLSGVIDRLDVDDRGKITIYDYKFLPIKSI